MQPINHFELGRQTGNRNAQINKEYRDQGIIENILNQAIESNDPETYQKSITRILSSVSPKNRGDAIQALQNFQTERQNKIAEQKKLQSSKDSGYDPYAPAGVQTEQVKNSNRNKLFGNLLGNNPPPLPNANSQGDMLANNANPIANPIVNPENPQQTTQSPIQTPPSENKSIANMTREELLPYLAFPETRDLAKAQIDKLDSIETDIKKDKREERKEVIEFHKETSKYDEDLLNKTKIAKKQVETIEDIEKAIKSGNVKPSSLANVFKGFGKIGDKISEALINGDQAALQASIPQLLEGWKEVFGVRLTDADLRLLQDKLPSIGKSPQANRAVLGIMRKYADYTTLRYKIGNEIKKDNKGLRPLGYADKIEARFDEMTAPVKIINPRTGKQIEIPAYQLSDAIQAGAKLAQPEGG